MTRWLGVLLLSAGCYSAPFEYADMPLGEGGDGSVALPAGGEGGDGVEPGAAGSAAAGAPLTAGSGGQASTAGAGSGGLGAAAGSGGAGAPGGASSAGATGGSAGSAGSAGSDAGGAAAAGSSSGGSAGAPGHSCDHLQDFAYLANYMPGDRVRSYCSGEHAGSCPQGETHEFSCIVGAPECGNRMPGQQPWENTWKDLGLCR